MNFNSRFIGRKEGEILNGNQLPRHLKDTYFTSSLKTASIPCASSRNQVPRAFNDIVS